MADIVNTPQITPAPTETSSGTLQSLKNTFFNFVGPFADAIHCMRQENREKCNLERELARDMEGKKVSEEQLTRVLTWKVADKTNIGHQPEVLAIKSFLESSDPLNIGGTVDAATAAENIKGLKILLNLTSGIGTTDDSAFGGLKGKPLDESNPTIDEATKAAIRELIRTRVEPKLIDKGEVRDITDYDVQNNLAGRIKGIEGFAHQRDQSVIDSNSPGAIWQSIQAEKGGRKLPDEYLPKK